MSGSQPTPPEMFDPEMIAALNSFDVPPMSADFVDRVMAALDDIPAAMPPLPASRPARDRRAGWVRRRIVWIGAPLALGVAPMIAAATGVLADFGIKIPVVTDYVTHHMGIKPIHLWHHQAHSDAPPVATSSTAAPQSTGAQEAGGTAPATPAQPTANETMGAPSPSAVNASPAASLSTPRHTVAGPAAFGAGLAAANIVARHHAPSIIPPLAQTSIRPATPRALVSTSHLGGAGLAPRATPEPLHAAPVAVQTRALVRPASTHLESGRATEPLSAHPFTSPETRLQAAESLDRPRTAIPKEFTHLQTPAERAAVLAALMPAQAQRRLGNEAGGSPVVRRGTDPAAQGQNREAGSEPVGGPERMTSQQSNEDRPVQRTAQAPERSLKPAPKPRTPTPPRPHQPRMAPHRR